MRYVIGVDGGQTSTTAVLAEETGRLLGVGYGGPANHIHEPGGVARVQQSLADAIAGARAAARLPDAPLACACLGMTGTSPHLAEVCRPAVPAERMVLGHDSLIALYSVTFGAPGVVVIGGTGSVGYGRDWQGRTAKVGGWGYLMGDEGSGYWIAMQALCAATRAADGRAPRTAISRCLLEQLSLSSLAELHRLLYAGSLSRPDIASLSQSVCRAAQEGDRIARRILRDAGRELGRLAGGVIRRLKMAPEPVEVGMAGGVFRAGAWVREPFTQTVLRYAPQAQILSPRIPAAAAACLLALEEIGIAVNEAVISQVRVSLPRIGTIKE
jgi:N-acetylglucosamine kinase-like BadF-type ATPase